MKLTKLQWFSIACAAALAIVGCDQPPSRLSIEEKCLRQMLLQVAMFENDFPNIPITNMFQLFQYATNAADGYPLNAEAMLRQFGQSAGITNSIYENYVMSPHEVSNPREKLAHVFLLNAQPFPNVAGELGRHITWRTGPGFTNYWFEWYSEDAVQQIFKTAGVEIPKGTPMPAPPLGPQIVEHKNSYPPSAHVKIVFKRFAKFLGLPRSQWLNLLACCVVVVLVASVLFFIWMSRRGKE